ncbi:aerobic glycerol-3-phosphate dehydrogenase [Salmonella enterica subsp. enterica]|uniref:Aerobic glycerol-3-phosphate dehydrogenase n=1 Tax=Salmonella enterica I TaxID=59201 RepID=A0A3S5DCB2_SALET|nr:aerobic glycerol-3-phosphate dehydrogenase [Salmonella enterica subsp. enterica]
MSFTKRNSSTWWITNGFAVLKTLSGRRTKEGMWLTAEQQSRITQWLAAYVEKHQLSLAS